MKISDIVRSKLPYEQMALKAGLYYTHSAAQKMRLQAKASAIVQSMQGEYANTQRYINLYTGAEIAKNVWEDILRKLGGGNAPVMLNIFSINRSAKTAVIVYLSAWNESRGGRGTGGISRRRRVSNADDKRCCRSCEIHAVNPVGTINIDSRGNVGDRVVDVRTRTAKGDWDIAMHGREKQRD